MPTVAYETAAYELSIKKDNDIRLVRWTVKNPDGTDYDFSNLTDVNLYIYDYKGGNVLVTRGQDVSNGVYVSSNLVIWNDLWSVINLEAGIYYYAIDYEDSGLSPQTTVRVIDGYLTIE